METHNKVNTHLLDQLNFVIPGCPCMMNTDFTVRVGSQIKTAWFSLYTEIQNVV